MNQAPDHMFSIDRSRKLASFFVASAGVMRLLGLLYLGHLNVANGSWVAFLPTVALIILAIAIYRGLLWAWALGFLLCAALAYQLVIGLIYFPWSSIVFLGNLVWSMFLTAADLSTYVLAIIFLFLMQYKKNRLVSEGASQETAER